MLMAPYIYILVTPFHQEISLALGNSNLVISIMAATTLTMKLLVDSSPPRPRVVFAEAGKDTVDFLFSLLAMPSGTAVKLLGMESMVGSIANLYASIEKLGDPYMEPGATKEAFLCPTVLSPAASPKSSLLCLPGPPSAPKSFYRCDRGGLYSSCRNYVTNDRGARCPACGSQMIYDSRYVSSGTVTQEAKGFVQGGMATYTVTDDLMIFPMSNISNMAMLNTVAVRNLSALQEKTVQIGYEEVTMHIFVIDHCLSIHMHIPFSFYL
jgi:DNA-directed RNA polymerase subunit RPC12/RpoP